jgi:hypothetical protein
MIQFYKPNAKVSGSACSFWMNTDGSVMASLIKQDSWNSDKKTGSFVKNKDNPKGRVIVKISPTEVGGIMDTIESNRSFSAYHSSQNQVLQIRFSPYTDKSSNEQKGFSFSVNKQDKSDTNNKVSFIIGFTFPEARYLKQYLSFVLDYLFRKKFEEVKSERKETSYKEQKRDVPTEEPDVNEEDDSWDEW